MPGETVTLKTGVELRAEQVVADLAYLRGMLGGRPKGQDLITDLYHFCRGERGLVRPENLAILIQSRDLLPTTGGELVPQESIKQVLLAAFQQTPEGVVLVNPLQPTAQNRDAFARAEQVVTQRIEEALDGHDPDEPSPPGRS
jgi:hypothetical protein